MATRFQGPPKQSPNVKAGPPKKTLPNLGSMKAGFKGGLSSKLSARIPTGK